MTNWKFTPEEHSWSFPQSVQVCKISGKGFGNYAHRNLYRLCANVEVSYCWQMLCYIILPKVLLQEYLEPPCLLYYVLENDHLIRLKYFTTLYSLGVAQTLRSHKHLGLSQLLAQHSAKRYKWLAKEYHKPSHYYGIKCGRGFLRQKRASNFSHVVFQWSTTARCTGISSTLRTETLPSRC